MGKNFFCKSIALHTFIFCQKVLYYWYSILNGKKGNTLYDCYTAKLGLPASEVSQIKTAALLHDIGQLSVPNIILAKLPFLSTREQSIYKRHCIAGASMLENIPGFDTISDIIRAHHEKWDGTGYPKRLKGQNIPIGARIVAVANYYDRNLNPCTQHWQKTHADAIIELQNKAGLDFDPAIVKAFIESVIPQSLRTQLK